MHFNWKKFLVGTVMTMATFAIGVVALNKFAPSSIKKFFIVTP